MKVVNLLGGPGSGKSTTAAGLFYHMKLRHMSAELVTEVAKDMVYDGRLDMMLDQQEWIFAEQNHRLHKLRKHVDWAITDSPLLLSHVYANDEWPCVKTFKQLVRETFETYDNICIYIQRPNEFQNYGRRHSLEQSVEIDEIVRQVLQDTGTSYEIFQAGPNIVAEILEKVIVPNSLNG